LREAVLITGVSSGIGLGMVRRFLSSGYDVIGSVRSADAGRELEKTLGPGFSSVVFDLTDEASIAAAHGPITAALAGRPLAVLVNNAGATEMAPLLRIPLADVRRQFETLVVGQLAVVQQLIRYLSPSDSSRKPGLIVNISSVSGKNPNPFFGVYSASKHALEGLSKTLRIEVQPLGVRVIVIAPDSISTPLWQKQETAHADRYKDAPEHRRLLDLLEYIRGPIAERAMSVEEFVDAFFEVVTMANPKDRYTIKRTKGPGPFGKTKVRAIEED